MKPIVQNDPGDVQRFWSQVDPSNLADVIGFAVVQSLQTMEALDACVEQGYAQYKRHGRAMCETFCQDVPADDTVLMASFEWIKRYRVIKAAEHQRTGKTPNLVMGGSVQ